MTEAMRLVFLQVRNRLIARFGYFEIFACDFLLDAETLIPRLIDISPNPSYSTANSENKALIETLLRDVVTMASDLHEPGKSRAEPERLARVFECAQQPYNVVYSEHRL